MVPKGIKGRFVVIGDECPIGFGLEQRGFTATFESVQQTRRGDSRVKRRPVRARCVLGAGRYPTAGSWSKLGFGATKYKYKARSWPKIVCFTFSELAFKGRISLTRHSA